MKLIDVQSIRQERTGDRKLRDFVLYYGIRGTAVIEAGGTRHVLKQKEIIVFNPQDAHSVDASEGMILQILLYYPEVLRLTGYQHKVIVCNTIDHPNENAKELSGTIEKLLRCSLDPAYNAILMEQYSLSILFQLITHYSSNIFANDEAAVRKQEILSYLDAHFSEDLTLEDIAQEFGLTPPYFSRYFARTVGVTFLKYLNQLRVRYAVDDLIRTDATILRIAINNGFSNSASFIREFRAAYGVSPSEYRAAHSEKGNGSLVDEAEILRCLDEESETDHHNQLEEYIACGKWQGLFEPYWTSIINLGSFKTMLRNGLFDQVTFLKNKLGFRRARMKADILFENSFYVLDRVMDFLIEQQMEVIAVLDMRDLLEHEDYAERFNDFCRHCSRKYGEGIQKHTVFELDYNTEFTPEKQNSYHRVYSAVSGILKKNGFERSVIGPGLLMETTGENLRTFVKANREIHVFTIVAAPFAIQRRDGEVFINRMTDSGYVLEQYRMAKKILNEEAEGAELLLVEWKDRLYDVDPLNDTEYMGARIIRNALEGYGTCSALPIYAPLDLMFEEERYPKVFNGLPGLINTHGIPKPAYTAIRFLNHQDRNLVTCRSNWLITASNDPGFFQIVCHNCKKLGFRYYTDEAVPVDVSGMKDLFEETEPIAIVFHFRDLPPGEYLLKKRQVSSEYGNAFSKYANLQYSDESFIGRDEMQFIRSSSEPRMTGETLFTEDGTMDISVTLEANAFCHMHLIKKR